MHILQVFGIEFRNKKWVRNRKKKLGLENYLCLYYVYNLYTISGTSIPSYCSGHTTVSSVVQTGQWISATKSKPELRICKVSDAVFSSIMFLFTRSLYLESKLGNGGQEFTDIVLLVMNLKGKPLNLVTLNEDFSVLYILKSH